MSDLSSLPSFRHMPLRKDVCVPHSVPASYSGSVSGDRCTNTYTNITTIPPWYLPLLINDRKEGLQSLGLLTMVVLCLSVCCCNSNTLEILPYLQYICKFLGNCSFVWRVWGMLQGRRANVCQKSACQCVHFVWQRVNQTRGGVEPRLKLRHQRNIETSAGFSLLSIITVVLSVFTWQQQNLKL